MKKIALIIAMISLQSCITVKVNADVDSNSFIEKLIIRISNRKELFLTKEWEIRNGRTRMVIIGQKQNLMMLRE